MNVAWRNKSGGEGVAQAGERKVALKNRIQRKMAYMWKVMTYTKQKSKE